MKQLISGCSYSLLLPALSLVSAPYIMHNTREKATLVWRKVRMIARSRPGERETESGGPGGEDYDKSRSITFPRHLRASYKISPTRSLFSVLKWNMVPLPPKQRSKNPRIPGFHFAPIAAATLQQRIFASVDSTFSPFASRLLLNVWLRCFHLRPSPFLGRISREKK